MEYLTVFSRRSRLPLGVARPRLSSRAGDHAIPGGTTGTTQNIVRYSFMTPPVRQKRKRKKKPPPKCVRRAVLTLFGEGAAGGGGDEQQTHEGTHLCWRTGAGAGRLIYAAAARGEARPRGPCAASHTRASRPPVGDQHAPPAPTPAPPYARPPQQASTDGNYSTPSCSFGGLGGKKILQKTPLFVGLGFYQGSWLVVVLPRGQAPEWGVWDIVPQRTAGHLPPAWHQPAGTSSQHPTGPPVCVVV